MALFMVAIALMLGAIGEARADIIVTPLLTSLLAGTALGGATVFGVSAISILSGLVTLGLSFGFTLLVAGLKKTPSPENGMMPVQQSTPFRAFGYGQARYAGCFALKEEQGGALYQVQALIGHLISEFVDLYVHDDLVVVPKSGGRIDGVVGEGADGRYKSSAITVDSRLGLVPETAYTLISGNFPALWSASCRGDGVASIASRAKGVKSDDFSKTYPNYAPALSPVMKLAKVFDPRDGAQSETDDSTWKYSDNPALAILHHTCHSPFGGLKPYARAIAPVLADWILAINQCDAVVGKKVGSEKRYRLGGWLTTEQERSTSLKTLLSCCDGWLIERGDGAVQLVVGVYQDPVVTITDADLIAYDITKGQSSFDRVNQVTARYCSPDNGYASVETTPLRDLADQARRGGPPRTGMLDLPWVQSTGQASRLVKREKTRNAEETRGTLELGMSGLNAAYARWIRVQSNRVPRLSNLVIENRRPKIFPNEGRISIEFIGAGPHIDAYDPATEESPEPAVVGRPSAVGLPIPANVSAVAEQVDTAGVTSIYLVVSWDEPTRTDLNYQVQWRIADMGGGAGPWTPVTFSTPSIAAGRVSVVISGVPMGVLLEVQVFTVATGKTLSTGSEIVEVDTVPATTAPGAPTVVSATGGAGEAALSCLNPNSANFHAIQFYRGASVDPFGAAVAVGPVIYGAPNATTFYTDTGVAAGAYRYWAVAISTAGIASSPGGPASATIT